MPWGLSDGGPWLNKVEDKGKDDRRAFETVLDIKIKRLLKSLSFHIWILKLDHKTYVGFQILEDWDNSSAIEFYNFWISNMFSPLSLAPKSAENSKIIEFDSYVGKRSDEWVVSSETGHLLLAKKTWSTNLCP